MEAYTATRRDQTAHFGETVFTASST